MERSRGDFKILTGKPIGKRPLGRPRNRWEGNIRMDLKEMGVNTRIRLIRLRIWSDYYYYYQLLNHHQPPEFSKMNTWHAQSTSIAS